MGCCAPYTQVFDSSQPARTNTRIVRAPRGQVTEIRAYDLPEGGEIAVMVQDPANPSEFVPYLDSDGNPVVLTPDNPEVDVPGGVYRLDPNQAVRDQTDPPVTVGTMSFTSVGLASVPAYYPNGAGGWDEVEVLRSTLHGDPIVYYAGTDERVPNVDPSLLVWEIPPCEPAYLYAETVTELPFDISDLIGPGMAEGRVTSALIHNRGEDPIEYGWGDAFYPIAPGAVVQVRVSPEAITVRDPDGGSEGEVAVTLFGCGGTSPGPGPLPPINLTPPVIEEA